MPPDQENPNRDYVTFFERSPHSGREGLFVAVDLDEADVTVDDVLADPFDTSLWMYVEGDTPEGPEIVYFEVDPDMTRIIGLG